VVINGGSVNSGRPTDKARNLRIFAKQWQEFEDEESLYGEDDAEYVSGALNMESGTMARYHEMADALEV
jgi:hypothetical protein